MKHAMASYELVVMKHHHRTDREMKLVHGRLNSFTHKFLSPMKVTYRLNNIVQFSSDSTRTSKSNALKLNTRILAKKKKKLNTRKKQV